MRGDPESPGEGSPRVVTGVGAFPWHTMAMTEQRPDLPEPITFDPANPPETLPELPPGYRWEITVTADAEVIHPDGTKD